MESVLGRYRNLIILVGVLFLQVLGLAIQVKRGASNAQDTRLIRIWAVDAITPFERAVVWMQHGVTDTWHNYFYLRGVRAENRQLKQEIEQMRLEQVRLTEDAAQARRLQTLLAFKEQFISKTVAAQVIGSSGSDFSRVIYIDKGENHGIQRDMAVITADGVVGKVLVTYPSVAEVLLINDQSSGVGAILEKSRLQGVLRGTQTGEVMLERVMSDEQVPEGETLLTSGGDQIFPKGLPVGTVATVSKGKDLFLKIKVRPAASLSKLEEVLVLTEKQERPASEETNTHVRAADILAQRLPSVPPKPVDAQGASASGVTTATGTRTGTGTTTPASSAAKLQPSTQSNSTQTAPKPQSNTTSNPQTSAVPKPVGVNSGGAVKPAGQTSVAPKKAASPADLTSGANSQSSQLEPAQAKPAQTKPMQTKPVAPPQPDTPAPQQSSTPTSDPNSPQ
jgi:rod shape-determining protein MreC